MESEVSAFLKDASPEDLAKCVGELSADGRKKLVDILAEVSDKEKVVDILAEVLVDSVADAGGSSESYPQRPKWLPTIGPGNMNVSPEKWAMTIEQWCAFIMACRMCTKEWRELEADSDRKALKDGIYKPYVNLYQVCDRFVKPWTRNLGNSIALLLNADSPLLADAMVSHAWGESLTETVAAMVGKASIIGLSLKTAIWFCTFAQYQPGYAEGDCGPGVAAQLALNPFGKVIESKPRYGMMVIHTSTADLYGRLWCCFEVDEAMTAGVQCTAVMSMAFFVAEAQRSETGNVMDAEVMDSDTKSASCWSKDDEKMIRAKIEAGNGFDALDERILNFRGSSLMRMNSLAPQFMAWCKEAYPSEGASKAHEMLVQMVRDIGAMFVALHCLYVNAKDHEDDRYMQQLHKEARECIYKEEAGLVRTIRMTDENMKPVDPPPGFDPMKRCDDEEQIQKMLKDDDFLREALSDLAKFPHPVGLLEMGAGGNIRTTLLQIIKEVQAQELVSEGEAFKKLFDEADMDGDGKIDIEEFAFIMCQLWSSSQPPLPDTGDPFGAMGLQIYVEAEFKLMFLALDANRDGFIDLDEFCEFLKASSGLQVAVLTPSP